MDHLLISEGTIEAEHQVLGAVFFDNKVMNDLSGYLEVEDFSQHEYRLIWKVMQHLYNRSDPITHISVIAKFEQGKKIEEVGGAEFIRRLATFQFTTADTLFYAKAIKRQSLRRKGLELARNIQLATMEDVFESSEEYLAILDSLFSQIRPDSTGNLKNFAETEDDYFKFLVTKSENIPTGFKAFDDWSGGIGRGWLYILAGRPSIGKTAKAMQMAINIARMNVGEVLIWSQEMTFNQLKNRILSPISGVNYSRIRKKELEPHEIDRVKIAHREVSKFPLYVEDSSGVTIDHIRSTARQVQHKRGEIGAIFVDYLTRMNIRQERNQTWSRAVGEVAKQFKWLGQELHCPVFLLAQLSREGADGAPQLHHLRDSGEVEQEADVVEFLWEDPDETSRDGKLVQSTIAKGRDIGTGRFKYLFKGWIQKYEDYAG